MYKINLKVLKLSLKSEHTFGNLVKGVYLQFLGLKKVQPSTCS